MKKQILALVAISMFGVARAHDISTKDYQELQKRFDEKASEFSEVVEEIIKVSKYYDEGEHALNQHKKKLQKAVNEAANGGKSWFTLDAAKKMGAGAVVGAAVVVLIQLAK
jgi:hypothetical protein